MRLGRSFAAAVLLAATAVMPAAAQSENEFIAAFSGEWVAFDPALGSGGQCRLTLSRDARDPNYALSTENCADLISGSAAWGIVDNQLALLDQAGSVLVRLGGNQNRMSGRSLEGRAVLFERAGTPAGSFSAAQVAAGNCLYLGYTATCAQQTDLGSPFVEGKPAQVSVLVNLNARSEARPDAGVVSVVPKNTCVAVEQCLEASDGRWCEAKLGETGGWIRQQAVRQEQWPVLTFKNGC